MKNAVIYARCVNNTESDHGIEAQLQECIEYAKKEGLNVVETYIDKGVTSIDERSAIQCMITDSTKRNFQTVLVSRFDHFARNGYDSAYNKYLLKKKGVRVVSVSEPTSNDVSRALMDAILEGMAECYSAEHSRKIKHGIAMKKQREAAARGEK